jgi:rubrerythrin
MELATFGAIMTFALEMEKEAADFYTEAAQGELEEIFSSLAQDSRKRMKRLERARREGVAEMILEPITGLNGDDYRVELPLEPVEEDILEHAITLEEVSRRFCLAAAKKIPVREVARNFERMAKENERRAAMLKGI